MKTRVLITGGARTARPEIPPLMESRRQLTPEATTRVTAERNVVLSI
jgi:hypothetical protein